MRYAIIICCIMASCMTQQQSLVGKKIQESSWWCLTQVESAGKVVEIKKAKPGFSYENPQKFSGNLGCNSFSGELQVANDGTLSFDDVSITEIGCQNETLLAEEQLLNKLLFSMNRVYFKGNNLVMVDSAEKNKLTFTSCESPAIQLLQQNTWYLKGIKQQGKAMHFSSEIPATFKVSKRIAGTSEYEISGTTGCNNYSGKIKSKKYGPIVLTDFSVTERACADPKLMEQEQMFIALLRLVDNFEFMGEYMFLSNRDENIQMTFVFRKMNK